MLGPILILCQMFILDCLESDDDSGVSDDEEAAAGDPDEEEEELDEDEEEDEGEDEKLGFTDDNQAWLKPASKKLLMDEEDSDLVRNKSSISLKRNG